MEKDMEKVLEKANVLVEALPYIQKFNRKVIVVKYGGSAMSDEEMQKKVIEDVVLLKLVGFKPIIVHGGTFHADDAFAAALVLTAAGRDIPVYRCFSVPEGLPETVIVADIGRGKYDHHQDDSQNAGFRRDEKKRKQGKHDRDDNSAKREEAGDQNRHHSKAWL